MRWFLIIILGFVLGLGAVSAQTVFEGPESLDSESDWDNSTQVEDWSVRAFVGRKLFVEARAKPDYIDFKMPDGSIQKRSLPALDTRYEARYEILDLVEGPFESSTIDFAAYDHYGRPGFPRVDTVLLFVISHDSEWVHSKYLYYPVQRTTDGDWAICGKPYVHEQGSDADKKLAASYEAPLGFIDPPELPDADKCKSGTRVHDLFAFQNKTRFIPRRNKVLCNREIGIKDYFTAGTGPGPFAEVEKQKHQACMDRLNAATLP